MENVLHIFKQRMKDMEQLLGDKINIPASDLYGLDFCFKKTYETNKELYFIFSKRLQ